MSEQIKAFSREQLDIRQEFPAFQNKQFSETHSFLMEEVSHLGLRSEPFGKASFLLAKMTKMALILDQEEFNKAWQAFLQSEDWTNYTAYFERSAKKRREQKSI